MSDQYVGELRLFGFNFPPRDWALCQGQLVAIRSNTALFSLLGTQYGGDGQTTFGLPNLQASVPVGYGTGAGLSTYYMGDTGGAGAVTLDGQTLGAHTHPMLATSTVGTTRASTGNQLGRGFAGNPTTGFELGQIYSPNAATTTLSPNAVQLTGGNGPHNNMQPYLVLNWCIALSGVFPPRP